MTNLADTTTEATSESNPIDESLDALEPRYDARTVIVEGNLNGMPYSRSLTQKPLSYFGKLEFFSLLGKSIEKAMSGEDGLTVDGILASAMGVGSSDLDVFVSGMARLAQYVPDLFEESYCIWLGVPRGEREIVKAIWAQSTDEGGLTDEDGLAIFETFIDQNIVSLRDFFVRQAPRVLKRLMTRLSPVEESPQPKPSKRTARRTAKV